MTVRTSVTPLGTGGYIPNPTRETACVLVQRGTTALLFDAGSGCRRLADPAVARQLNDASTLHVMLTHLHHDHICGLTWLVGLWKKDLRLYVPTAPILTCDGVAGLNAILTRPYFSLPLAEWPSRPRVIPIRGDTVDIEGIEVNVLAQRHDGGSAGYRAGPFAYITDTEPDERHVAFLRDTPLVFMDTMYDEAHRTTLASQQNGVMDHGSSLINSRIARAARIERLGLVHLEPTYDGERVDRLCEEARTIFPNAFVPREAESYFP